MYYSRYVSVYNIRVLTILYVQYIIYMLYYVCNCSHGPMKNSLFYFVILYG